MTQITQITQGIGGNTYTNPRSRKWCLTLNNYSEEEITQLLKVFDAKAWLYIIGKEMGEQQTPHLQMYIEMKNQVAFNTLKKLNARLHLEKARGSRAQNIEYCSKEMVYKSTFPVPLKTRMLQTYDNVVWKQWQQQIIDLCQTKPDSRTVHWVFDKEGNSGKSFLVKYLCLRFGTIVANGKANDIFNQVATMMDSGEDKYPEIVVLDIPRSNKDYVSYGAIEKLKDGLLYSGKYEGRCCIFPSPHVICFSNSLPEWNMMSDDRWRLIKIDKESI